MNADCGLLSAADGYQPDPAELRDFRREARIDKILDLGQDPAPSTPAELTAHMRNETGRWAKVIKEAGLKPER